MPRSIGDALRWNAAIQADKIAVVDGDRRMTFAGLNARVNRLGNVLLGLGLRPGDRIAVLMTNCSEYVEVYQAIAKLGAAAVPLNFRFMGDEIEYVVTHSGAKALALNPEFLPVIRDLRQKLPAIGDRFLVTGAEAAGGMLSYEGLMVETPDSEPAVTPDVEACFFQGYTAGTTGFPKGCVNPHRGFVDFFKRCSIVFGLGAKDIQLVPAPMFHEAPALFHMQQLFIGGTVVVARRAAPADLLSVMQSERTTNAFMVPTMWNSIVDFPERFKYDVSSMRVLICAGAPLLTKTKEGILGVFQGGGLHEFYGGTEVGVVTNLFPEDQRRKVRCVGKPILGFLVRLLDENGKDVAVGSVGEIYIKGPILLKEYYRNPEATAKAFRGEWITLGDMGRMDEEGYLYIVDRKHDMIISGGENLFPTEIEEILVRHPKVQAVVVVGVPDPKWGEAIKAVVVPKPGQVPTAEELVEYCRGKMAGYKVPKSVDFVGELPTSSFGKVLRRVVRERYWQEQEIKI